MREGSHKWWGSAKTSNMQHNADCEQKANNKPNKTGRESTEWEAPELESKKQRARLVRAPEVRMTATALPPALSPNAEGETLLYLRKGTVVASSSLPPGGAQGDRHVGGLLLCGRGRTLASV